MDDSDSGSESDEFSDLIFPTEPASDIDYVSNGPDVSYEEDGDERNIEWDMKLRDAITGKSEDVLRDVEQALYNRADANSTRWDGTSNLALAFKSKHLEPVREDTIRMLLEHRAKFTDDDEECYIYRRYAHELSPCLLEEMVFNGHLKSIDSRTVMSEMRFLIMNVNSNAADTMKVLIYQAKNIFLELKEKNKEDENDEYMDLDDFLSEIMHGNTLLHLVLEYRLRNFEFNVRTDCLSLLRVLIDNGAQLSAKDAYGHTPREVALRMIGSNPNPKYVEVTTMLQREEYLQEAETREVDRQKIEAIAMTMDQRIGQTSKFKDIDPAVIFMILETAREKEPIHVRTTAELINMVLGGYTVKPFR